MGPELPELFILPAVAVALHDVLVSAVTGVLVAHEPVGKSEEEAQVAECCCCEIRICWGGDSRSGLDPQRSHFVVAPAHGLEGGVVVAELALTAQEVLALVDGHTTLSVVLQGPNTAISETAGRVGRLGNLGEPPTHSAGDGSEGGHPLDVVGVAAAEGVALRVLAPLQDELLPLVGGVLVAHPAVDTFRG